MRLTPGVAYVVGSLLWSVAASAAPLTGDVFITLRSGDLKRAVDVDVLVVPATPEFDAALARLRSEYEERIKPIYKEYETLSARRDALPAESYDQRSDLAKKIDDLATSRWVPLQKKYTTLTMRLVSERATARTATDVNGHFEINVPTGSYYLYSRFEYITPSTILPRRVAYWLVPVRVPAAGAKTSLSSRAAKDSLLVGPLYTSL